MAFDDFKASFKIENGKLKQDTKKDGYGKHVCMVTNAGLIELRKEGIDEWTAKLNNNEKLILSAKQKMYDLTLTYDIGAMRCAFEVIGNPKHEQK